MLFRSGLGLRYGREVDAGPCTRPVPTCDGHARVGCIALMVGPAALREPIWGQKISGFGGSSAKKMTVRPSSLTEPSRLKAKSMPRHVP